MDTKEIKRRFESQWSERKTVEQDWQQIERMICPGTADFFKENAGEHGQNWQSNRMVFDSTAIIAARRLAASIHGTLTNPAIKWFQLEWRRKALRDNYNARIWLENASRRMFDELQDSDFNMEANMVYKGITTFATAAIIQEPMSDITSEWKGLNFTAIPLKQVYFETDEAMQALIFYRHLQWPASRLVAKFGLENVPERVQKGYERADTTTIFDVIYCCFPRDVSTPQRVMTPENRPWGYKYVMRHGPDDEKPLKEGGYYEMPAYIVRWDTAHSQESKWGRGPSHDALPDVGTLNELVELDIRSREKVVDPAILYQERALVNTLDLGPGAQNACRDPAGVIPFESAARFDAVESSIARLQMQVQDNYFIDQLQLKESPAMTATEVQVRYEMMQRLLSGTMDRLKEDFLNPLLQRTFNLLYRAGEFGPVPEGVEFEDYDIHYVGPLSRAMKFDEAASIERFVTQMQLIAQAGGEAEKVLYVLDYDKIARGAAATLNLPTEYLRDPDEVQEEYDRQQAQQTRQASADAASVEAAAAKDLGQAQQLAQGDQNIATGP